MPLLVCCRMSLLMLLLRIAEGARVTAIQPRPVYLLQTRMLLLPLLHDRLSNSTGQPAALVSLHGAVVTATGRFFADAAVVS